MDAFDDWFQHGFLLIVHIEVDFEERGGLLGELDVVADSLFHLVERGFDGLQERLVGRVVVVLLDGALRLLILLAGVDHLKQVLEAWFELVLESLEVRLHEFGEDGAHLVLLADDFVEFFEVTFVFVFLNQHGLCRFQEFDAVALQDLELADELKDNGVEVDHDEFFAIGARDAGENGRPEFGLVVLDGW